MEPPQKRKRSFTLNKMKYSYIIILIGLFMNWCFAECDSSFTYFDELPGNVTILVGDSCLNNNDIAVLDSIVVQNELEYNSPLELGTQTWFNGRLRFLVAGNYGNSSGVNDTIYVLPDNFGDLNELASLYLEWNRISELPESFSDLSGLFSVYLNNNILSSIGDSIGNLSNLYFLDLGYNHLQSLPESICSLNNLDYLWLFNNELDDLPECFCDMELDWNNNDNGGVPFFAIGANYLCDSIATCVAESDNFELSLDQFYYSFPVLSPQNCDSTTTNLEKGEFPYQYHVSAPYPNPFNPTVNIDINIPFDRKMNIQVFNSLGQEVSAISIDQYFTIGKHSISWDGSQHPSGVYYVKFSDGFETKTQKIIFLK